MLTVQEAAERVRLTHWAVYRAIRRGDLAAFKPGGRLRIDEADFTAWLESTRVQAEPRLPSQPVRTAPASAMDATLRPRKAATESLRARVRARRGGRPAA
jgi:excisionase family DNA binding protein